MVECEVVECGGVWWSVVECGGVWWSVVECGGVWWSVGWCGVVESEVVEFEVVDVHHLIYN